MKDYDRLSRKILDTIIQAKNCHSKEIIALVLFGSKSKKVICAHLNELSTYGAFLSEKIDYQETLRLIQFLVEQTRVYENTLCNKTFLSLSYAGVNFLFDETQTLALKELPINDSVESTLEIQLKQLRKSLSQEYQLSPFIIFDNRVLKELEQKRPCTREAFLQIKGLGELKWAQFGERVIDLCRLTTV